MRTLPAFALVVLSACENSTFTSNGDQLKPFFLEVGRKEAQGSLPDPCTSFVYEYTGLYPIIDTLPVITEDSIYMDMLLKEMGMNVIDYGWGNWQLGPRMINMKLALGTCTCDVTKAYFLHEQLPDS